ncbi:MAG: substrate-binding domain-containing protein, partial [Phycisphaerae bacterium]
MSDQRAKEESLEPAIFPEITTVETRHRHVLLALGWYAEELHAGVAKYARKANWALDASLLHAFEPSQSWNGDGIIWVAGVNPRLDHFMRHWRKPVVNIGYTPTPGVPRVVSDPDAVMQMALEHFQSRGFEHFAFYLHVDRPGPRAKMNAFAAAVKAVDGTFHLIDLPFAQKHQQHHAQRDPYRWLADTIRKLPQPLAVVAETDDPSIQVLHACVASGIRVPEQVAILGINDDLLRCLWASIPLSSIDDNMEQIGFQAAEILDGLMSGKTGKAAAPPLTLIPPRGLTVRQSTDILAVDNPAIAEALRLIKTRFRETISAQSIAGEIPMSQRQL